MSTPSPIALRQGLNIWELYCTDKHGLSAEQIIDDKIHGLGVMLDAVLSRVEHGQPMTPAPWQEIGTGGKSFRIGSARPVTVISVGHDWMQPMPAGDELADRNRYPGDSVPSVVGQHPWIVRIALWWRATDTHLPWPAFTSLFPALPDLDTVSGAEWALARAVYAADQTHDPGEESWGTAQTNRVKTFASDVATGALTLGVTALVAYFAVKAIARKQAKKES